MGAEQAVIERWWSNRAGPPWVDAHGFSLDDEWFTNYAPTARFTLDALDDVPLVVLLGEGGAGKSTELHRWEKAQQATPTIWLGARNVSADNSLQSELQRRQDFVAWQSGDAALNLCIDGLDEASITPLELAQSLRHTLSGYSQQLNRLKIRLACRTTAWSEDCERELEALWKLRPPQIIQLRPLSRANVIAYFEAAKLTTPKQSVDELIARGLGAVLTRPHLLRDVVDSIHAGDELSVVALRRSGVRRQLSRSVGRLPHAQEIQRRATAQWIAALSILQRKPLAWMRRNKDTLSCHARVLDGDRHEAIEVRGAHIEELFESSMLFEGLESSLDWAHQSWAEFLCAEWVASLDVSPEDKCALFAQQDGSLDVLPEWIDATLSYAAMIDAEMRRVLTARAPLALLESDGAVFDSTTRLAVVQGVFSLARRLPGRVKGWDHGPFLSRFADVSCDALLAEILSNKHEPESCRWIALWGNERTPKLIDAALRVSLDEEEPAPFRSSAAARVAVSGTAAQREQLRPLLAFPSLDRGRLALEALDGLWRTVREAPSLITFDELLETLRALGGVSTITRLHVRLLQTLSDTELARLLKAIAGDAYGAWMVSVDNVFEEIFSRHLDPFWIERFAEILAGDDDVASDTVQRQLSAALASHADRTAIAQHILSVGAVLPEQSEHPRWRWVYDSFVHNVPLSWLLTRCSDANAAERWCLWATHRFEGLVLSDDRALADDALEQMMSARASTARLAELTKRWFDGMTAEDVSPVALQHVRKDRERRNTRAHQAVRHNEQRAVWLASVHDPESFWQLVVTPEVDSDGRDLQRYTEALWQTHWWTTLPESTREKVLDAAEHYLSVENPHIETWYLQSTPDNRALAGRIAIDLLLQNNRPVPASVYSAWSHVILEDWRYTQRGEGHKRLIEQAAAAAPAALSARAAELVQKAINDGQWVFIARNFANVPFDELLDQLPSLMSRITNAQSVIDLFEYWHRHRGSAAEQFARAQLADPSAENALHVGLSASLVATASDECWTIAAAAFERCTPLLLAVISAKLPMRDHSRGQAFVSLSTPSIARMWRVWLGYARVDRLPADGRVHTIPAADDLGELMTQTLQERASTSAEDLALWRDLAALPGAPAWMSTVAQRASVELSERSWTARTLDTLRQASNTVRRVTAVITTITNKAHTPMKRLFSWVHLSDIHFGHGARDAAVDYDQQEVTEALLNKIREECERLSIALDATLVTGDVAFSGKPDEYDAAKAWFTKVIHAAKIDARSVFLVPGNHDVSATTDDFVTGAMVDQLRAAPKQPGRTLAEAWKDDAAMATLLRRQENFWQFASDYGAVAKQGTPFKGWWTHDRTAEGRRVRIIGINTALLSAKQDNRGQLELGAPQRLEVGRMLDADIVLLMSHHPFDGGWLKDENDVKATFGKSMILHLSGHIHDAKASVQQNTTGLVRRTIAAGAVHRDGRETGHQFSICSIVERDGQRLCLQRPYTWDNANKRFVLDVSQLPESGVAPGELMLGPC